MDYVDTLRLDDFHWHDDWTKAPHGALLQMAPSITLSQIKKDDLPVVGMRISHVASEQDAFLILGGPASGLLLTQGVKGAALDVTSKVEIVAVNPAPFERANHLLSAGMLIRYADQDVYFVWVRVDVGTTGGVCVHSNDPNCPVGTFYSRTTKGLIGVAEKIDLRLRDTEPQMFKIGETYTVKMLDDSGDDGTVYHHGCKIIEVGPSTLIMYQQGGEKSIILNAASAQFVSATLED